MIVVLAFLGVSAVPGSLVLLVPAWTPPRSWLDDVPLITSWLIPGLVLGIGFGLGSLVAAWGVWKGPRLGAFAGIERVVRHHWSWVATLALGIGQVTWISLELAYLPDPSPLQAIFGTVGLTLCVLPLVPSVRLDLRQGGAS
jgi:hypothetical protein